MLEAPAFVAGLEGFRRGWVSRPGSAVVILALPETLGHSPKARLAVTIERRSARTCAACDQSGAAEERLGAAQSGDLKRALVKPADQMEEQLAARLGEGQGAGFIQHNKVKAGQGNRRCAPGGRRRRRLFLAEEQPVP